MSLINELRMLAEDLYSAGGHSRYAAALSKAADELASLKRCRTAYNEWIDKTEWVQADTSLPAKYLGMHRADVLKDMISELFGRLEAAEKAVTESYQRGYETGQEEIAAERDALRTALEKIADWDSAWGPYPETNEAWRAMVIVTAREAVPRRGEKK